MLEQLIEIAAYGVGRARERAVDILCAAHPAIAERLDPPTVEKSAEDHSLNVVRIVALADGERQRIGTMQSVAAHHLEVAERTLHKLLAELSRVMPNLAEIDTAPLRAVLEEANRLPASQASEARDAA